MRLRFFFAVMFVAANAFAVAPQFWRVRAIEDFLAGDIDGFAVTSRGELRAGPSVRKVATFTDPFVLAQTAAPNGDRFFGTGNDGKIYRLRGSEMKLLATAPEPEVYAVAFRDGAVYAGTSPNGKVYRIDPESGKSSVFFEPKQAYIWALQFLDGGDLAVGTGVQGKLFRVTPAGAGKVVFDAPETHIRSIAVRKDGTLLAGGSGQGRIYEVRPDGTAHALYDSALNEITAVFVDSNGIGWAAGVSNVLPTGPPAKPAKPAQQPAATSTSSATTTEARKEGESTPPGEVSFSFDSGSGTAQAGSSELYRIHPDGFVETVRKFEREMIYALSGGPNGSIMLSTGPQGRIYNFRNGEISLVGTAPEKQVVSISSEGGSTLVTTTNSGAVYRLDPTPSLRAEFRSQAKDVERFSHFGHYRLQGSNVGDGHLAIAFRSGNTRTPDSTWSSWSMPSMAPEGTVGAPAARYVQWKLTMPKPALDVAVNSVSVGFINRNVPPVIDSVTVQEPAVVFIGSSYPSSPQVVEATNPDEYGIFTSLDNPREKNEPGKKLFRKGFRTITWRAHDDNGDNLRYSVAFRPRGSEKWLRLRDNIEETQINFDTSQFPDGIYELRLSVTDANDNPDMPLTDVKEGVEFQVDNTPPVIVAHVEGDDVIIRVTDKIGTIGRVEYSADAQRWTRLTPVDGIADSGDETYKVKRSAVEGKFVIVRAVDSFYNVATESITLK
jgi:hypothetical protein